MPELSRTDPPGPAQKPRRFGKWLSHDTPPWVEPGSLFHLRIRAAPSPPILLTDPGLARAILDAAEDYHVKRRWWLSLLVLMPDHLHALAAFPPSESMSKVIGQWKAWLTRYHRVAWQDGYFDHRLRDDERGEQLGAKAAYLLNNPVARGLCARPEDWPWKLEHR